MLFYNFYIYLVNNNNKIPINIVIMPSFDYYNIYTQNLYKHFDYDHDNYCWAKKYVFCC